MTKSILFLLAVVTSTLAQPFPPRPGPVIISQPSTGTGSGTSSSGASGIVSNAYNLTMAINTYYTNTSSYYAQVTESIQLSTSTGGGSVDCHFYVSTNTDTTWESTELKTSLTGNTTVAVVKSDIIGSVIPPGGVWMFTNVTTAAGAVCAVINQSGIINYSTTNGSSSGSASSALFTNGSAIFTALGTNNILLGRIPIKATTPITNSVVIGSGMGDNFSGDSIVWIGGGEQAGGGCANNSIAIGAGAGAGITLGSSVCIGNQSDMFADSSVAIGAGIQVSGLDDQNSIIAIGQGIEVLNWTNVIIVGRGVSGTADNQMILGNTKIVNAIISATNTSVVNFTATGNTQVSNFVSYASTTPVNIAATGWTNIWTTNSAFVSFQGTAMTWTNREADLTGIDTNTAAVTGPAYIYLQPGEILNISGTGVTGRARPL